MKCGRFRRAVLWVAIHVPLGRLNEHLMAFGLGATSYWRDEMDRNEWLRRYRARLIERRPSLTSEELDELANIEAHEALSAEYPDNPEKAVDDEAEGWPESQPESSWGARANLIDSRYR